MSADDILLPPTIQVGEQEMEVIVHPCVTSLADAEQFVHVLVYPLDAKGRRQKVTGALAENPRVPRTEDAITEAIITLARKAAADMARAASRRRLLSATH